MATIPNEVIREQRIKVEYIIGLYNQMAIPSLRVDSSKFQYVYIETTAPINDAKAIPRHIATISTAWGGSYDYIEFELTDKQFLVMERMLMMAQKGNKLPAREDSRFRVDCNPEIKELPALLMSRGLRDAMPDHGGLKASVKMLALQCPCPKGFFCSSVKDIFITGRDITHWGPKTRRPRKNQPVAFFVAVPVVDYILYSVPIEASIMTDWDDNEVSRFMTYGITEDVTTFWDDPRDTADKIEFYMLRDQIVNVKMYIQSVMEDKLGMDQNITDKTINAVCTNSYHTYGTNRKVMEFMNSRPDATRVAVACLQLYDMCPCCYVNANPAFSLLDDSLF